MTLDSISYINIISGVQDILCIELHPEMLTNIMKPPVGSGTFANFEKFICLYVFIFQEQFTGVYKDTAYLDFSYVCVYLRNTNPFPMLLKIGLLGGSFNPPHHGHLYLSLEALKRLNLHQVWWLFCKNNPLKQIRYESFKVREKRARAIVGMNRKIRLVNSNDLYTYKTLKQLKSRYPQCVFTWIMGMDSATTIHLWERWEEIIRSVRFAVFNRGDYLHKCMRSKFISRTEKSRISNIIIRKNNLSSTLLRSKDSTPESPMNQVH
ncbi:cytidylyltransferase family protein [Neorickettsia helminthoeca str. Oregon]|uniref:nicotinate-nucleotide adenylyltransferase n=2 Tax=Neorickettsia helminthoeca TaxID=33994 RepID=X5H4J5_9RICK|nr:cytidylyltransferase family protein [Neorickettsia helminthoeca str. Oregon]